MNKEFLKGIQAREKAAYLQKVHTLDSVQLKTYRDSIIPEYQNALIIAEEDVMFLNNLLDEEEDKTKYYQTGFWTTLGLFVLFIVFN